MAFLRTNAPAQAPGFHRSRVGAILVTAVHDGFAKRPIAGFVRNADEPAVAAALREAFLPEDAVPIPFTTLVLETEERLVLIDTGNGDAGAPTSGAWMANFRAAGYRPEDVDTILVSHFHPDHVNGLRLVDGAPVFPGARIRVPRAEWDFWMDDARMAAAPEALAGAFRNARRVFGPMRDGTEPAPEPFDPGEELVPGVTAIAAPGHTPGHTAFRIVSEGETLLALSDVTNHPALFVRHPDWRAVFDIDPEQAEATRRRLLGEAAETRTRIALYHAPFPATGHVARDADGFAFVPVQWSHLV
ncbi:MBL fold metallo-hydrolase [Salinarimonas sp.]|uniref:MBL fold metallo-hydrolase n=1 Tax=Salinarimonas sp. TaxID=2766526 RepID=UPI0032D8E723